MEEVDILVTSRSVIENDEIYEFDIEENRLLDYDNDFEVEIHATAPSSPRHGLPELGISGQNNSLQRVGFGVFIGVSLFLIIAYIRMQKKHNASETLTNMRFTTIESLNNALTNYEEDLVDCHIHIRHVEAKLKLFPNFLLCLDLLAKEAIEHEIFFISNAQLQQVEVTVKRLESILSKLRSEVMQDNLSSCADLDDFVMQTTAAQCITNLSAKLHELREMVCIQLYSHTRNALKKCIFDVQSDLMSGMRFIAGYNDESSPLSDYSAEFEITTRRITSGVEMLKVYDSSYAYESIREQAFSYLKLAYAIEDEVLRKRFEVRASNDILLLQPSESQNNLVITETETNNDSSQSTTNNSETENSECCVLMNGEAAKVIAHVGVSSVDHTSFYNLKVKNETSVSPSLEGDYVRCAEQIRNKRLELRLKAESDADARYRQDSQAERDEKSRLASTSVQQSLLRNAEKQWADLRRKDLTEMYNIGLKRRISFDLLIFMITALLSVITYAVVVFRCAKEWNLLDALVTSARTLCAALADRCDRQNQIQTETPSLKDIDSLFKVRHYSNLSGLFFGKVFSASQWLVQTVMGGMWDAPLFFEFASCLGRVLSSVFLPFIVSKTFSFLG